MRLLLDDNLFDDLDLVVEREVAQLPDSVAPAGARLVGYLVMKQILSSHLRSNCRLVVVLDESGVLLHIDVLRIAGLWKIATCSLQDVAPEFGDVEGVRVKLLLRHPVFLQIGCLKLASNIGTLEQRLPRPGVRGERLALFASFLQLRQIVFKRKGRAENVLVWLGLDHPRPLYGFAH